MDQIKAFISHSSDDALYVDVLINLIGKNSLVVDRFCFESGERTIDEIIKSIDNSGKHSKKCTFYTLRFGCSFAAVNTIKPQLL